MKQKAICLTLVLCLAMALCPMAAFATPSQSDFNEAVNATTNKKYSGAILKNGYGDLKTNYLYKVRLNESGKLKMSLSYALAYLDGTSEMQLLIEVYDANQHELSSRKITMYINGYEYNGDGISHQEDFPFYLNSGSYYLCIRASQRMLYDDGGWQSDYLFRCNFSFKLNFASAKESFKEKGAGSNNTITTANHIKLNKKYAGLLALNDTQDFYRFKLSKSRRLRIKYIGSDSLMDVSLTIYKANGKKISKHTVWKDNWLPHEWEVSLKSGIYYLQVLEHRGTKRDGSMRKRVNGRYSITVSDDGAPTKKTTPLVVGWKRRSWGSGYLVKVATDRQFKKCVRLKVVSGRSSTHVRIKNLPKGRTYYVKVRPYKKHRQSGILPREWMRLKKTITYKPWSKTSKIKL